MRRVCAWCRTVLDEPAPPHATDRIPASHGICSSCRESWEARARELTARPTFEVIRGYVDSQFVRNCYTLAIITRYPDGSSRHTCWEFSRVPGRPMRFMGTTTGAEISARIAGALREVADRFEVAE